MLQAISGHSFLVVIKKAKSGAAWARVHPLAMAAWRLIRSSCPILFFSFMFCPSFPGGGGRKL